MVHTGQRAGCSRKKEKGQAAEMPGKDQWERFFM